MRPMSVMDRSIRRWWPALRWIYQVGLPAAIVIGAVLTAALHPETRQTIFGILRLCSEGGVSCAL